MIAIIFGGGVIGVSLLAGLGLISTLRPHTARVRVRIGHAAGTALAVCLVALGAVACLTVALPVLALDTMFSLVVAAWRRPRARRIAAVTFLASMIEALIYWPALHLGAAILITVSLGQLAGVLITAIVMISSNETLRERCDAAETGRDMWETRCRKAMAAREAAIQECAVAIQRCARLEDFAMTYHDVDEIWLASNGIHLGEGDAA